MMKIDIFAHILTDKYLESIEKNIAPAAFEIFRATYKPFPAIANINTRFQIMDKHKDYLQILIELYK